MRLVSLALAVAAGICAGQPALAEEAQGFQQIGQVRDGATLLAMPVITADGLPLGTIQSVIRDGAGRVAAVSFEDVFHTSGRLYFVSADAAALDEARHAVIVDTDQIHITSRTSI